MDMTASSTQAKVATYPAVPERFYVFMNEKNQYLCTTFDHAGLFWSDRLEWAVRGKNPRKARDCAKRIEPETYERFLMKAWACIVGVSEKYPRQVERDKAGICIQKVHVVPGQERARLFHGVTGDGLPTAQLSKAIGVPAKFAEAENEMFFARRYVVAKSVRPAATLVAQRPVAETLCA